ncbi:MAG: response regulator transcription factor [Candidatus Limnocylindria bacterium]
MRDQRPIIAIVDDDASVRRGLARLLRSAGYWAETYASALEFLERGLAGKGPVCLMVDVRMPGLSGLDLHEALVGEGLDVPFIFITGHGDGPMTERAAKLPKADAVDFLAKPFDDQAMLAAVAQALGRAHRATRDLAS